VRKEVDKLIRNWNAVLASIAGISLLVGGIGFALARGRAHRLSPGLRGDPHGRAGLRGRPRRLAPRLALAAASAVMIGLAAGVYRALRASRLTPVDAIRAG
jgi:ABC-type antimicrobial peptide transport system permease subunit